jgi:hypothetical protein
VLQFIQLLLDLGMRASQLVLDVVGRTYTLTLHLHPCAALNELSERVQLHGELLL